MGLETNAVAVFRQFLCNGNEDEFGAGGRLVPTTPGLCSYVKNMQHFYAMPADGEQHCRYRFSYIDPVRLRNTP